MAKATLEDAYILLELEELKFSPAMEEAFAWFSRELAHSPTMSYKDFMKRYPEGSDAQRYVARIGQFYETMGTLAKHGLVNTNLLFDRYGVQPFWEKLSFHTEHERKADPNVGNVLGENFEWLANQNQVWLKKHLKKMKKRK
ncbi:MAG TPA: hypothetical protein VLY65_02185 [Nitrososphaerales archaeon]|nr:hypothetical protein [Nitrososphaerales archaeon]